MAGIGNVKGLETRLWRPLRLDYNCGPTHIRAFLQCELAHYEQATIRAAGVEGLKLPA